MRKIDLSEQHEALTQEWIVILSCFFYPIALIYLALRHQSILRQMPYFVLFLLTLLVVYSDPRVAVVSKEGLFPYVLALSASLSWLLFVFSDRSELPALVNKMKLRAKSRKQILITWLFIGLAIGGFTFLLLIGCWPRAACDVVWSEPNWQAYVRLALAVLLLVMSLKLLWSERMNR